MVTMFHYDRSVMGSLSLCAAGVACPDPTGARIHYSKLYAARADGSQHHLAILGLLFILVGFANFAFTLVLHAAAQTVTRMSRLRISNSTSGSNEVVLLEKVGNNL